MAVRARDGHREDVAHRDIGRQLGVADEQVALLAVLARDRGRERARRAGPLGKERLVARAVGDRPQVVAHAAVDRDVRAHAGDRLDRADPV